VNRTRYQFGTVARKHRASAPDVWVYRYFEGSTRKSKVIGTVEQYRKRADALKAAGALRLIANPDNVAAQAVKFRALVDRYVAEELPQRFSTGSFYKPWIKNHLLPKWGEYMLPAIKPFAVEQWLKQLVLAPKSKVNIRSLMHIMFNCAMRWDLIEIQQNPISLVRVKDGSKRIREPRVLSVEEVDAVIAKLKEPHRTMAIVAACLGLRVSEIVGLQWGDVDWNELNITVQRGVVRGRVDDVKTKYSRKKVPLDPQLAEVLLNFRTHQAVAIGTGDWIFANPDTGKPWLPYHIQQDYIRPAAIAAGLGDGVGWHAFRHSYSTLLRHLKVDVKVQQELLRHADIRTTLNTYTVAVSDDLRDANSKVVRMVLRGAESIAAHN
jgi:integrase